MFLAKVTELDPEEPLGWLWRAGLAEEPEQALIWINRALDLDPQHPQARRALPRVRLQAAMAVAWSGDFITARTLLHQAAADDPSSTIPWIELAAIAGTPDEARYCLTEILRRDANHAGARQCLAHLDMQILAMTPFPPRLSEMPRARVGSTQDLLIPVDFEVPADIGEPALLSACSTEGRRRILIVDDTPSVREFVRRHIEEMGFRVIEAQDAKDAVAKLEAEGTPDLILLDGIMPGTSGFELCNQLRQREPTAQVPIVLLAFENGWLPSLRSMMSGFNDTLAKPIVPSALRAMVSKHCCLAADPGNKPSSTRETAEVSQ